MTRLERWVVTLLPLCLCLPLRQHLHFCGGRGGWKGESVILILSTLPWIPTPLWRTRTLERWIVPLLSVCLYLPFRQHLYLCGGRGGWRGELVIRIVSTLPWIPTPLWRTRTLERWIVPLLSVCLYLPFRQHLYLCGGRGGWRGELVIRIVSTLTWIPTPLWRTRTLERWIVPLLIRIVSTLPWIPTPLWRTRTLERWVSDTDRVYLDVNTYTSVEDEDAGEVS